MTNTGHGVVRWAADDEDGNWYIAIVNPNCLARAEGELSDLGYRVFTPKLRKWVSHARVKKPVWRPILGRYLFVDIDDRAPLKGSLAKLVEMQTGQRPNQNLGSVRACNGVEGMMSVGGAPVLLPKGSVEALIRRQLRGEWDYVSDGEFPDGKGGIRINDPMPIGARVKIVEGELEGWLATLVGAKRGKIAVKLLGKNVTKNIYPMMVRPAA
jgi:transcription antitermination factor NusG